MKYLLIIFMGLLIACGPSESAVQTAIAETETARPTETVQPSEVPTLANTPTEPPPVTFVPFSPNPTPNVRIIVEDSKTYLLNQGDLPANAKYYLPDSSWINRHTNDEIVGYWGREEGLKYLDETGRIEGWFVSYKRGSNSVIAPEEIYCNIIRYETSDGARLSITKYGTPYRSDEREIINLDLDLGDEYLVSVYREMQSNGKQRVWYRIEFSYRNYVVAVQGWGWNDEVSHDYVYQVALTMLEKLKSASLANP